LITREQASQAGIVHQLVAERGADTEMSLEELFDIAYEQATRLATVIAGTPAEVADILEEKFEKMDSVGGFMLNGIQNAPAAVQDIANLLVPELQARGVVRKKYEGNTLREHFGLPSYRDSYFGKREAARAAAESAPTIESAA
jgi:alkanesulfonate monooxygenase SsuD/methylene tetrahydromethanopterin reductase-like flavin-dependent oxidoreductase (luciferase family)